MHRTLCVTDASGNVSLSAVEFWIDAVKKDEVPQDKAQALGGQRKLMYAVDDSGAYTGVASAGWEAEDESTMAAVHEIDRLRDEALARARAGKTAPLEYHMYARRMEPATLSQTTGWPEWRVKRHFRPEIFRQLPANMMARYVDALGLSADQLKALPPQ
jgi:hypothetical protein